MSMAKQWYIIHTYSGFEKKVKESLEGRVAAFGLGERIGRVMIPTEDVMEVRGGKEDRLAADVLSGLRAGGNGNGRRHLARGALDAARHGICRFRADALAAERGRGREHPASRDHFGRKAETEVVFERNEQVRIVDGPFANFTGMVEEVNAERSTLKDFRDHFRALDSGRTGFCAGGKDHLASICGEAGVER